MKLLDGYVRSPFAGIAPWVLMAVVNGPGRFEEAASAALGLAILTLWVGSRRGVRVHLLEAFTVVYFGVLAVLGLVASDGVYRVAATVGRGTEQYRTGWRSPSSLC